MLIRLTKQVYYLFISQEKHFTRQLRSVLGFTPVNLILFRLAFHHRSNSNDKDYAINNNERLEYLGDAVLGTIVAEYLFKKYPYAKEGFLTKMRSKIVKRKSLNDIAQSMGLDVLLNTFNQMSISHSMLGNALEALVGAMYLEYGYGKTRDYVVHHIMRKHVNIHELEHFDDNFKSQLLEYCQKNGKTVDYKLVSKYKMDKRDRFRVAVYIDGEKLGSADDFNKKSAEQLASEKALQHLGLTEEEE